jgi:CNT family concentrative nucleoside transporter
MGTSNPSQRRRAFLGSLIAFVVVFLIPQLGLADSNSLRESARSLSSEIFEQARHVCELAALSPQGAAKKGGYGDVLENLAVSRTEQDASARADAVVERGKATASDAAAPKEIKVLGRDDDTSPLNKLVSLFGIFALLGVAYLMSTNRQAINWQLVATGIGLQLLFAIFIFYVPGGQALFEFATEGVKKLLDFTSAGSKFIFQSNVLQEWHPALKNFAFSVLPTIIFFSSLMTILYHLGVMQKLVYFFAYFMQKLLNTSGAETLSAAANIFVGQTEAPLVVKPYVEDMTVSELMVVMTGGFATVAGGVMAIYVGMLEPIFPDIAGHLISASVMSAPAALVIAKIMYPETEVPETSGDLELNEESPDENLLGAASRGAGEGLTLALNVGAMLLAFLALIALVNYVIGLPSLMWNKQQLEALAEYYNAQGMAVPDGCTLNAVKDAAVRDCAVQMNAAAGSPDLWVAPNITLEKIFGYIFWPFAWLMGVPFDDCYLIAQLLGEKMVVNELVAYSSLAEMLQNPDVQLSSRSVVIATYALCGFANFGSIGIQLGGIGGIAPSREGDLAKIALRAMIGGTLAAFMTATVAGVLV